MSMKRIAVVTGASAGIGRAIVREYARKGYDLGLIARGTEGLEAARREVEALGGRALSVPTDVSDAQAVEAAAERIENELGPIDLWTNVAFAGLFAPFEEVRPEEYRRVTEVSYLGYVYGTMSALRRMRPRNHGTIIQVGSALCYRSIPLQAAYCGAKAAIRGFTDSLRSELIHEKSKIRISLAVLPAVNTPQFSWGRSKLPRKAQPVPPIYQPEVIARAVAWLVEHPRRELLIGWPTVTALIGQALAPGFADRVLGLHGYDAQQYDGGEEPGRPDNLMEPLPGDWGAHGAFDSRSRTWSSELWLTTRGLPVLGCLAAAAILFALTRGCSRKP